MNATLGPRLGWFTLGACTALVAVCLWPARPAPEPSEREERIARDLRIAKEVERDLTALREREATRRSTERADQERRARERREGPDAVKPPKHRTLRPETREQMVGRWTDDDTNTIWLRLYPDRRYRYGGIPGEFIEGPSDPGGTEIRNGRRIWRPSRRRAVPGYAERHVGTWTYKQGVLRLEPDEAIRNADITFTWDPAEAALRVRFLGVAPSHITGVILRRVVIDDN